MTTSSINLASTLAIYRDYYIQLTILETLVVNGTLPVADLLPAMLIRMRGNNLVLFSVKLPYLQQRVDYLHGLGMVMVENDALRLTDYGINALRNGTFQNMVSVAFFNYRTLRIALLAFYVGAVSALIAGLTLFFTLYK